ncbi:cytochrome P450 [Calycina marina]|uniref:Cytochrome P450 n=1 Tax=Calycina marina TaxID=1763456 RepID=A0A9P8CC14_9HELO|nr:cytochrome P450 [Calycina marina]
MAILPWEKFLLAFGLGWLGVIFHRVFLAPLSRIPGPWYAPFLNTLLVYKELVGQRRVYVHNLHKKYGPVVRLGPNEVSFTSLEALKEIYQSDGSGYNKTEFYNLFRQYGLRTTFSSLSKADHTQMKRYIAGPYANSNIMHPEVLSGIEERATAFIKQCIRFGSAAVDVYILLHCFALDCASLHLFKPHGTKSLEGTDIAIMRELSFDNSRRKKISEYRFPTLSNWRQAACRPATVSLANEFVLVASVKKDVSSHTLAHKLQNSNGAFQNIQIAAECMNHMFAGIDTTGDALCFLMYHLSLPKNFDVQERLIAELTASPSHDIDELQYLEAVVKEGLRCFPPIPMSQLRRVPLNGRRIDGYFIPAGVTVSCQAWSVHQLNEDVFPQGNQFVPERWLDPKAITHMNKCFFSFGLGGRGCTGRNLALAEEKCLLRQVYSRYRTKVASEMRGSSMALSDQAISTRPVDQTCKLVFEPLG